MVITSSAYYAAVLRVCKRVVQIHLKRPADKRSMIKANNRQDYYSKKGTILGYEK